VSLGWSEKPKHEHELELELELEPELERQPEPELEPEHGLELELEPELRPNGSLSLGKSLCTSSRIGPEPEGGREVRRPGAREIGI